MDELELKVKEINDEILRLRGVILILKSNVELAIVSPKVPSLTIHTLTGDDKDSLINSMLEKCNEIEKQLHDIEGVTE